MLQEVVVNIIVHYKKIKNSIHFVSCIVKHHPNNYYVRSDIYTFAVYYIALSIRNQIF